MAVSYTKALDDVLRARGFNRSGDDWIRVRGDMWECVNRQSGRLGVTINFLIKDLKTEALFLEIFGSEGAVQMPPRIERIGALVDGFDRWWKSDEPDGAKTLADMLLRYGLPWFDTVRTLEQQVEHWYGGSAALNVRGYSGQSLIRRKPHGERFVLSAPRQSRYWRLQDMGARLAGLGQGHRAAREHDRQLLLGSGEGEP